MFYALSYLIWLPVQGLFIRLLSAAAERVLLLVEHPPILTALTASGSSITIHSYVMGASQPLTRMNCESFHITVVTALALALSVPLKRWSTRAKACGLALTVVFFGILAVCVVQLEWAAEVYASTHLGITLYTASEKEFLDWAIRKTSLAAVYLVPAFLFLVSYLSVWSTPARVDAKEPDRRKGIAPTPGRSFRTGWPIVTVAAAGCVIAGLLLIPTHDDRNGRVDLEGLQKIVTLNPSAPRAHFYLALNLEKAGRLDEALVSYQQALQLQPNLAGAHLGAGNVYYRRGAYDQAARSYEEALKREPQNAAARYNLGNTFLKRGLFDLAAQSYEEAAQSDPDDASVQKMLGETLMHLNRRCDALAHLERSTVLDRRLSTDATLLANISILKSTCRPQ